MYRKTRTTDKSSKLRKYLTELIAFDTFQVPLYSTVIAVGSLASNLINTGEFKVDFDKVERGTEILLGISPLVSPTMGLYMEGFRKMFGLKSAPRKARESLENRLEQKS